MTKRTRIQLQVDDPSIGIKFQNLIYLILNTLIAVEIIEVHLPFIRIEIEQSVVAARSWLRKVVVRHARVQLLPTSITKMLPALPACHLTNIPKKKQKSLAVGLLSHSSGKALSLT